MRSRILFVDDDPNMRQGLRRMLHDEEESWEMTFAENVPDALEVLSRENCDVAVLDIRMPGRNGLDLLSEMKADPETRKVEAIVLTGLDDAKLKRRALDLGATDLLNKPVSKEDLTARLRNVLRLKSAQDRLREQNEILEEKVKERTKEIEESHLDIVWRLAKAGEYRDEDTGNHIVRVGCCCRVLAERLGLPRDFVELILLASPLHDIGKIGIPDSILLKCGKLSSAERKVMETHCAIGSSILLEEARGMKPFRGWRGRTDSPPRKQRENPFLRVASTIAMTHHEKWDGTGYPQSLKGDAIPLESRIVATIDVYDALRSERPYKPALSEPDSLATMREQIGRHFDPEVFAAFEAAKEEINEIRNEFSE